MIGMAVMDIVSDSASGNLPPIDIQQLPAVYRWMHQGTEYVLCNCEVLEMPDDTMIIQYIVIVDGRREGFRVWRQLGYKTPEWIATDVTGFLSARGFTPVEAMLRVLL